MILIEEKNGRDLIVKKICELLYSKFQGKKELINHSEKGKVLSFGSEAKRPLIFPTPNLLTKICFPNKFLNIFKSNYPFLKYSIKNYNRNNEEKKFIFEKFAFLIKQSVFCFFQCILKILSKYFM